MEYLSLDTIFPDKAFKQLKTRYWTGNSLELKAAMAALLLPQLDEF